MCVRLPHTLSNTLFGHIPLVVSPLSFPCMISAAISVLHSSSPTHKISSLPLFLPLFLHPLSASLFLTSSHLWTISLQLTLYNRLLSMTLHFTTHVSSCSIPPGVQLSFFLTHLVQDCILSWYYHGFFVAFHWRTGGMLLLWEKNI